MSPMEPSLFVVLEIAFSKVDFVPLLFSRGDVIHLILVFLQRLFASFFLEAPCEIENRRLKLLSAMDRTRMGSSKKEVSIS